MQWNADLAYIVYHSNNYAKKFKYNFNDGLFDELSDMIDERHSRPLVLLALRNCVRH